MKVMRPAAVFLTVCMTALPPAVAAHAASQAMVGIDPGPVPAPPLADQGQDGLDRFARARDNLTAILDGRLNISALTPQDMQDVIDLDRALRDPATPQPSFRQQCIDDEVRRAGGRPTRLAWQVIRLKCR